MERKNFELIKAKIVRGSLEVAYKKTISEGGEVYTSKASEECTREFHPDLLSAFKACDECFNDAFGVSERISTVGISLSGTGVVLTGLYRVANDQCVAVNTPRIRTDSDSFGFEDELRDLVQTIEDEVFAYLYEGKQAQLQLFGE